MSSTPSTAAHATHTGRFAWLKPSTSNQRLVAYLGLGLTFLILFIVVMSYIKGDTASSPPPADTREAAGGTIVYPKLQTVTTTVSIILPCDGDEKSIDIAAGDMSPAIKAGKEGKISVSTPHAGDVSMCDSKTHCFPPHDPGLAFASPEIWYLRNNVANVAVTATYVCPAN